MSDTPLDGYGRYAVYYAPPRGSALAALGAAWLGRDAETDRDPPPLEAPALEADRPELVRNARRYGFHATLKAPFELLPGITPAQLDGAVAALAAAQPPAAGPALAVDGSLGFVALRPTGPCPEIDRLAAACVTDLDLLRAPMSAADLARRRRGGLETVEDANLRAWGYPYVLDRFRFHMTLSIRLSRAEAAEIAPQLATVFEPALDDPFVIQEIALFGDPGEGRPFRLLRRYPLGG